MVCIDRQGITSIIKKLQKLLSGGLGGTYLSGQLHAASITTRAFGSLESGGEAVVIQGDLEYGDIAIFNDLTARLPRQTVVVISSPGGNLKAGIEIGRLIRRNGFRAAVSNMCPSACALAWLAGSQRFASQTAHIGFHVAYLSGEQKTESGIGNAIVGHYVGELGFSENVVTYVTSAPPNDMQWLSFRDAALVGIDIETIDDGNSMASTAGVRPLPVENPSASESPSQAELSTASPTTAAIELVRNLVESDMARGRNALTLVRDTYADRLSYYGKKSTFASVYSDKQRYFARWPVRNYVILEDTFRASCDDRHCPVTGIYDWQVANAVRNKAASGVASFSYLLEQVAGNLRVVSEEGEVIK